MYPLINAKTTCALRLSALKRCYSRTSRNLSLLYIQVNKSNPHSRFKDANYYCFNNNNYSQSFLIPPSICVGNTQVCSYHLSSLLSGQEPSSKVEETVKNIKEEKEEKDREKLEIATGAAKDVVKAQDDKAIEKKKTIWQKVKAECLHYYHGFRLLGLDMKVSAKLIWRILRGHELSRREHRLLVKTTGDMFRLIPFSVFIIVPFMEFLLPIAIKIFPGLLPSTFETSSEKDAKLKQALKVKIEMAKFLQQTLDEMAVQSSDHKSEKAKEFSKFFYKIRTTGSLANNEEIMKFSKLFEDEITLDSLSRAQLIALCRVLDIQTLGTTNFLRFLLRMKLRRLAADDRLIEKEGVDTLTRAELQQACRARGMRAYGMSEQRLREQLLQWLDLSLTKRVPPSLLLLSRALMVPENIPMTDKLKATISALPDSVVARTKGSIGEKEGKLDHKTNIEIIKMEEQKIKEEREEEKEIKKKETEKPQPIVLKDAQQKDEEITATDVKVLEQALDSIGKSVEKEEIKELKEEMAEYQEDIKELYEMKQSAKGVKELDSIKVSKGAKRLYDRVNKMIGKMDAVVSELEKSEKEIKDKLSSLPEEKKPDSEVTAELVKIDELIGAIKKIQNVPDDHRLVRIAEILGKIDDDRDGSIKVEDMLKVIELIGKEDVKLNKKQLNELLELMEKEEVLELEEQIQKALEKEGKSDQKNDKDEEAVIEKSSSKSTVPATPVTKENKLGKEELNDVANNNNLSSVQSANKEANTANSRESGIPVTPKIPHPPKKAEGVKQL